MLEDGTEIIGALSSRAVGRVDTFTRVVLCHSTAAMADGDRRASVRDLAAKFHQSNGLSGALSENATAPQPPYTRGWLAKSATSISISSFKNTADARSEATTATASAAKHMCAKEEADPVTNEQALSIAALQKVAGERSEKHKKIVAAAKSATETAATTQNQQAAIALAVAQFEKPTAATAADQKNDKLEATAVLSTAEVAATEAEGADRLPSGRVVKAPPARGPQHDGPDRAKARLVFNRIDSDGNGILGELEIMQLVQLSKGACQAFFGHPVQS
eukprot:SAG31_NODE_143_length_22627_cov_14.541347_15_plen_276_part_00